ncbi:hypothetical protein [Dyadobacter jiangsuensis]|uniref:Uncharacterized protein n=1 Tax=Dyadobacter jiangsuensis TaxID=1591085 RepID=A0A2P8FPH3_9BACT|nr:hypothetical protein [Dyadobacter jiangsuensis]PSL23630.1 hypothetical protein CLV60_116187 [Dyadobacter jiangsuensis]
MYKILKACLGGLLLCSVCEGQDLEKLGRSPLGDLKNINAKDVLKKSVSITGMAAANFVYYRPDGIQGRNIPFNTLFTGNLSVDLFGKVRMPVSFSLSNQNINWSHPFDGKHRFIQPFNRFVIKPTYKGFTLSAGVCSLNFSPLTLAGHRYDGVGLEYRPKDKPFYFGLMLGNLRRAVRVDSSFSTYGAAVRNNIPSYKRSGAGIQLGYRKKEDKVELIFFTAKDRVNSLPYTLDDYYLYPQQNAVASVKLAKAIQKEWLLDGEIAVSGITNDVRASSEGTSRDAFNSYLGTLPPNASTEYKKAIKGGVTYRGKGFNAGVDYSRIEPGYRTLGAYYFADDLENISAKLAGQLFQGKLNASVNAGIQHDNVQKQKLKTLRRWVGAANVTYVPAEWLTVMASYSNFTSYSNLRPTYDYLRQVTPYQALDTINFRQVNQNIQAGLNIVLPSRSENITQSVGFNTVIQRGSDQQGSSEVSNNLSNLSLDYNYGLKPLKLNVSASVYYSASDIFGISGKQWGPSLGITKGFGSETGVQWKTQLSGTYTTGEMSSVDQSILNLRAGASAGLTRQLNLNFNVIYLDRKNVSTERYIPSFSELTATLGLVYNFSVL